MAKLGLMEFDDMIGGDSYVLCRGKQRIDKDIADVYTAERHLKKRTQNNDNTIGWWVRHGYVVVDVDEGKEEAKRIIKELGINTLVAETNKGLHIYFKTKDVIKQSVGMTLPCGLKCDTRSADKGYVLLPFEVPGRRFNSIREIADLPLEFTPIAKMKESLLNMGEGSRNTKVFSQLAAYRNMGATEEQIEVMAHIINDFVLQEPLDEDELAKVADNAKKQQDGAANLYIHWSEKGKPNSINQAAIHDYFVNLGDTVVVGSNLFRYRDGIYKVATANFQTVVRDLIEKDAPTLIKNSGIQDCLKFVLNSEQLQINTEEFDKETHLVNLQNGVYNIETGELVAHDPKYRQTIQIPYEVKEPTCEWEETRIYKFLVGKCDLPPDDVDMIADFMAYSLTVDNSLKAFMALHGPTNTGKSVLINFIRKLVGEHNVSSLTMANFNERFMPAELFGKILNAAGDESAKALEDVSFLKKITGEDTIKAEYKGQKPFDFKPFAKLIFSFNQLPLQLEEKSGAFYGRMRILYMGKALELNNKYVKDLHSKESIEEALPHLLARMPLEEIPRSMKSKSLIERLREDSDSIHAFIKKKCNIGEGKWVIKKSLYESYKAFCRDEERHPHGLHQFNRHIKDKYKQGRSPKGDYVWKGLELKQRKGR